MKLSIALLSLVSVALACNGPRPVGSNPNCANGNYTDCAVERGDLCNLECANQPPGECLTGCTTRAQQQCAADCMAINNCEDCMATLTPFGASEDSAYETCSEPGDNYYCNCG